VNLNISSTKGTICVRDVNAKELLGDQSTYLSELHRQQVFDSREICKKSFYIRYNLSGDTIASSREMLSHC
jgi:hypothetical protein